MHFGGTVLTATLLSWVAQTQGGFDLSFLPKTTFRVGMLINVPFYDNIFHGLMFRGNYPIYPQVALNATSLDRWALYTSLEGVLERLGMTGRGCLLRSVCEAAAARLDHDGLLGAVLHLVLSPSSSSENGTKPWHRDYVEAENWGQAAKDCSEKYKNQCPIGFLDTFTKLEYL